MVERKHTAFVARGCTAKKGFVRQVPGGIFETPPAKALVLTPVAPPRFWSRNVDARAGAVHQFEVAVVGQYALVKLLGAGGAQPVVLGVRQVHKARSCGGLNRSKKRFALRDGVSVADDDDVVRVLDKLHSQVATRSEVKQGVGGIHSSDVDLAQVRAIPGDHEFEGGHARRLRAPGNENGQHDLNSKLPCARGVTTTSSVKAMSALEPVGPAFVLADVDPESTPGQPSKRAAEDSFTRTSAQLSDLQERLFAASKFGSTRSVLLVLQAMDTAGKGGIVRHVVGEVDPQGVHLHAFKAPTEEEKSHDFLWRVRAELPPAGIIGVFDRSHYEDVLIHRVRGFSSPEAIEERYGIINDFEAEVEESGTAIIKVMLQISSDEQKSRLQQRLERPDKQWKYNPGDVDERVHWNAYQEAYQIALTRTSTADAPWYVVPANHKWYARWAVQQLLLEAMMKIDPQWPEVDYDIEAEKKRLAAT